MMQVLRLRLGPLIITGTLRHVMPLIKANEERERERVINHCKQTNENHS